MKILISDSLRRKVVSSVCADPKQEDLLKRAKNALKSVDKSHEGYERLKGIVDRLKEVPNIMGEDLRRLELEIDQVLVSSRISS